MSNARKITRLVGLMVLMAFAFSALTGSATAATKKQKSLLKQVKKNPAIVKNKKFIKKAVAADFELPVTVRFNRCLAGDGVGGNCLAWGGTNDTVALDLGATLAGPANADTTITDGVIQLWASFADPRDGDEPGTLRLSNASNVGNPTLTSTLSLEGIDVLENADITTANIAFQTGATEMAYGQTQSVGTNGCMDIGSASTFGVTYQQAAGTYAATSAANRPATLAWSDYIANYGALDGANGVAATVTDNVVFRTAPITATISGARGDANLFSGNVDLTVDTDVDVNAVFREQDNESPLHCMEAITGNSDSSLTLKAMDSNGLEIDPAITKDGKLRLANVTLGNGPITRAEIEACLQPIRPYNVNVTELMGLAIDLTSGPVAVGTGTTIGVNDLPTPTAISAATGGAATSANFASGTLGTGPEQGISCGTLPAAAHSDGSAAQFNPLYQKVAPMAASANHVELRPDVSIQNITAEGLIGHYAE